MTAATIDTARLELGGPGGVIWSLPHGGDLDANVVVVHPGGGIDRHANNEVDVVLVGLAGAGTVAVDDRPHRLHAGVVVHVPKRAVRTITAGVDAPLVYLTVHRARPGLTIGPRSPQEESHV